MRKIAWALPVLMVSVSQAQFPPDYVSTQVHEDRSVTFRVFAPNAKEVRLGSSDLPFTGPDASVMKKNETGVWEVKIDPVPAGAYRYNFLIDGLSVHDPRNSTTSESNNNSSSLLKVAGAKWMEGKEVPSGALAEVRYHSKSLDRERRMHVYTPPGYENGEGNFPVLYLLHGATDSDDSWGSVGMAGVILDSLIAAGKAKPMIVVMPMGHTGPFRFGPGNDFAKQMIDFEKDFVSDLKPFVEKRYRLKEGRENRAIAGLSMGGAQTLNIAFGNLKEYSHIGVFSSGIFGIAGGFGGEAPSKSWEENHRGTLDDKELKEELKLLWFATGKDDFLLSTTEGTVKMLKEHQFDVKYVETEGGHTWLNWRDYLLAFAPQLFQE